MRSTEKTNFSFRRNSDWSARVHKCEKCVCCWFWFFFMRSRKQEKNNRELFSSSSFTMWFFDFSKFYFIFFARYSSIFIYSCHDQKIFYGGSRAIKWTFGHISSSSVLFCIVSGGRDQMQFYTTTTKNLCLNIKCKKLATTPISKWTEQKIKRKLNVF